MTRKRKTEEEGTSELLHMLADLKTSMERGPLRRLEAARIGGHAAQRKFLRNAQTDMRNLMHAYTKTLEVARLAIQRIKEIQSARKSAERKASLRIALLEEKLGITPDPGPLGLRDHKRGIGEIVFRGEE